MNKLNAIMKQYWGFDTYLPLQREAMQCVAQGRDSLVILPTGGGKSLCYQAPVIAMQGMAVVISPLLSLMKDQVDALTANGVPSVRIDSAMTAKERAAAHNAVQNRSVKLLYVSPERMAQPSFIAYLQVIGVAYFVVDEAHCISHWGHDFRPEYRELRALRDNFPDTAIHAYTATATQHVRDDIIAQLHLREPEILIGNFDRPNLAYTALQRHTGTDQTMAFLAAHKNVSGIVYCLRRADVDELYKRLIAAGYKALPYHAGMTAEGRKRNQEAFSNDEIDIIVATIAFGMGIDKSNVRYVLHTAMPKSIEHYQQETGRAGRDGLPADCCLLYSYQDFVVWGSIIKKSEDEDARAVAQQKLRDMLNYSQRSVCRHKALAEYFGQPYNRKDCRACDVCQMSSESMENARGVAADILTTVHALGSMAGPTYTTLVLTGSREERVLMRRHNKCPGYGALKMYDGQMVRDWIEQLVQQGYLEKRGEYNVLFVTDIGRESLNGKDVPKLSRPVPKPTKVPRKRSSGKVAPPVWVDPELFMALRKARLDKARELNVPPYVVFSDAALRDMARRMPANRQQFLAVEGVGEKKCEAFGDYFVAVIRDYKESNPDSGF